MVIASFDTQNSLSCDEDFLVLFVEVADKSSLLTGITWLFTTTLYFLTPATLATFEQSLLAMTIIRAGLMTYALETLALPRLRTPLPVRLWPRAGELDSGITVRIHRPGRGTDGYARNSARRMCQRERSVSGHHPISKFDPALRPGRRYEGPKTCLISHLAQVYHDDKH